jgi:sugar porter (SP) family MFS transporter
MKQKSHNLYIFLVSLVASVAGFLFGFDFVIISGALSFLDAHFHLSDAMKGLTMGSAILGSLTGPLIGLWFADKLGRRKTMMVSAFLFLISTFGSALAITIWDFVFWRFLSGVGVGLAMMTSPIYMAELAPADVRGRLVNVIQLCNVIGINLAVVVSYIFSFDGWGWRWMFGSTVVPVALFLTGLLLVPESPRWLATKNRVNEALQILTKINGKLVAENEMKEIQDELKQETGTFRELFEPGIKTVLFIGIVLMIFSQINGVAVTILYAPSIIGELGIISGSQAILNSLPIFILMLICTIISFKLIDRYSRRGLLIISIAFIALSHLIMAINLQQHWPPLVTLIPMLLAAGSFDIGLAPLSWVIVSEIFPNRVRSNAMGIVCFFLYLSSYVVVQFFPILTQWFITHFDSMAGMYWIFLIISLAAMLFCWKFIPETKGLSLEKISEFWQRKKSNDYDQKEN